MNRKRWSLLGWVMLSHLIVAVAPAAVLGITVLEVNRATLILDARYLHLAVASRISDAVTGEIRDTISALHDAERTLELQPVSVEEKKELLRQMVAAKRLDTLSIHDPAGAVDSVFRAQGDTSTDRTALDARMLSDIEQHGYAVSEVNFADHKPSVMIAVKWMHGAEKFGYLSSRLDLAVLSKLAAESAEQLLDAGGEIDVADGARRYLASSVPARLGETAGADSPFASMVGGAAREGISAVSAGVSTSYAAASGEQRLGAMISSPETHWLVAVSRPERVAFESLSAVRRRVFLLAVIAALAAGMSGLFFARGVSQPIHRLARAVRQARLTGFRDPIETAAPIAEVEELGLAFQEALGAVREYRARLREKSQLQLRLARFMAPAAMQEALAREMNLKTIGEKGTATIVFLDVTHSREAEAKTKTADLINFLGTFFAVACKAIEEGGGRIDRFSGDAVIGVFNAARLPDHASAALEAAKTAISRTAPICAQWGEQIDADLDASAGIVTGDAHLREDVDGTGESSAVGAIISSAAALQGIAAPGKIVVAQSTRDLLPKTLTFRTVHTAEAIAAEPVYELANIDGGIA